MRVIEIIGDGYYLFVEPLVSGLAATDRQYCGSPQVKGVEHSVRFSSVLVRVLNVVGHSDWTTVRSSRELHVRLAQASKVA